jgi:YD repeat-containing protein
MAHDVFISYSTHDKPTADALCATLEAKGIRCWIAPRDIVPGTEWGEAIIEALQTSRIMVLVFSSHANSSPQIRRELERAVHRGLIVIPVRIENVIPVKSLAYFIGPIHWLDALTPPLESHLQNLAEAVRLLLSEPGQEQRASETEHLRVEATEPQGQRAHVQPAAQQAFPTHSPRAARRQRVVAGAAMVLGLVLLAGSGGWYWDAYRRAHVDYYANVNTRWGLPEGVGRLTAEQMRQRNSSLEFHKHGRRGPVDEIRLVNSRGAYPPEYYHTATWSLVVLNPLPPDTADETLKEMAVSRVAFERDARGRILNQIAYNRADRRIYTLHYVHPNTAEYKTAEWLIGPVRESGIALLKFVRPEHGPEAGLVQEVRYFDSAGTPQPDRDGSYGSRFRIDARGLPVQEIYLGADGQPAVKKAGIATETTTYDALGNPTQTIYFGRDGQPHPNKGGYAGIQAAYDPSGNVQELAFLGTDGQLVTRSRVGAAGRRFRYDGRGNIVESSFFDLHRQPVTGRTGGQTTVPAFARQTTEWDEDGGALETYFGPDGNPIVVRGRIVKLRAVWDTRGYPVETSFFDEHKRPIWNAEGCAKDRFAHDAHGNLVEQTCLDDRDHPIRSTEGFARIKWVHDDRGNAIETLFFGPTGRPERYEERYVKVRATYNLQGKVIEQVYLDAADHPVPTNDGYAKFTYKYDLQGQLIEASFFDAQDQLTLRQGGYAQIRRLYDARGNLAEETFFDPQGDTVRVDNGYAKTTFAYDDRGYRIEQAHFDKHGKPALHTDGNAMRRSKYNERGQLLEHAYYGLDGSPVLLKEHRYAKKRWTYDAHGKVTQVAYFDPDDRLVQTVYGFAIIKFVYDNLGRETKREFLDVDGVQVHTRVAIWKFEPGSNGQRLGLQVGDLLLNYDGEDIGNTYLLREMELVRGERPRELRIQRQDTVASLTIPPGRLQGLDLVDRVPFGSNKAGL